MRKTIMEVPVMNLKTTIEKLKKLDAERTQGEWTAIKSLDMFTSDDIYLISFEDSGCSTIAEVRHGAHDKEYGGKKALIANTKLICESANQMPKLLQALEIMSEALEFYRKTEKSFNLPVKIITEALEKVDKLFED